MPLVPFARYEPVPAHSGTMAAHNGLVLHVQVGNGDCFSEFDVPANEASSTWWCAKDGTLVQYLDSDLTAWTEAQGNPYWDSVETEGFPNEPLTNPQILTLARLYVWGHQTYGWPLVMTDDVNGAGFIWHGAGGSSWGGHVLCPGEIRKAQRAAILFIAAQVLDPTPSAPPPPPEANMLASTPSGLGYWIVHPDGSVYSFGDAGYHGGLNTGAPVAGGAMPKGEVAISITSPSVLVNGQQGYWIHSSGGHVYGFGGAGFHGNA